jgi:hypothetical protein
MKVHWFAGIENWGVLKGVAIVKVLEYLGKNWCFKMTLQFQS